MKFDIAIGTEKRKKEIANEIETLLKASKKYYPIVYPKKVIIPFNFKERSCELNKIIKSDWLDVEQINDNPPMGETFCQEDGYIILLSRSLCETEDYRCQRKHTFLHEIFHGNFNNIENKKDFSHYLFNEYCAERFAFELGDEIIAPLDHPRWKKFIALEMDNRIKEINDRNLLSLTDFVNHNFDHIATRYVPLLLSLTLLFANYHQNQEEFSSLELFNIPVLQMANKLMEFYRENYHKKDLDISNGNALTDLFFTCYINYLEQNKS